MSFDRRGGPGAEENGRGKPFTGADPVTPRPASARDGDDDRVCTVVVRWSRGERTRILALRDELTSREFDDPGRWWPDLPDVIAGRDRAAGGTWCATRISTGATALVLNRPEKPLADPGAPSRGVLPLRAAVNGADWISSGDLGGMASFTLVLATSQRLTSWVFDGHDVVAAEHPEGTHMFTSGGPENRKADAHLSGFRQARYPDEWRQILRRQSPKDDPAALVVRHEDQGGRVFATVFGQLVEAQPGRLRLDHSRQPWTDRPWQSLAVG